MIKMADIEKYYGNTPILSEISLEIPPGQFTAFIGPNGAGKSSLLLVMSRLLSKDKGQLVIKGQDIETWDSKDLAKELTMLKQKMSDQVRFTVEELVAFGRFPYSQGRLTLDDAKIIEQSLRYMDLLDLRGRLLETLSGGQLQRVYIAMVLAQDTDIILLDEPLNNLDMKQGISLMKRLRRLVDELNKTVIMVVHDINMASQFVDYMVAFKNGKVFASGQPDELMTQEVLQELYEVELWIEEIRGKRICIYR